MSLATVRDRLWRGFADRISLAHSKLFCFQFSNYSGIDAVANSGNHST
ncbi:hypothetical protein [Moorena sp. SIO3I6]|nr:hypothetical protein [Moorena sp. SIO3I6]NEP29510.1 hypothetical protein [Moorena sp. SIO3I6]